MKRLSLTSCLLLAFFAALPLACGESDDKKPKERKPPVVEKCESDEQCADGLHCNPDGKCVACTSSGHCDREELCDIGSWECIFRPGWGEDCSEHADCAGGQACLQGLCVAADPEVFCNENGRCPEATLRCNPKLNVCEEDIGCSNDEHCGEGFICNTGTSSCERACTPENAHDVCSSRQTCVDSRCVECQADEQCGPGMTCNVEAGRCVTELLCFTDRDCDAGKICNPGSRMCTDPLPPCASDADCISGYRCDLGTRSCVALACQEDRDEPNEDRSHATRILPGLRENLTLCGSEEDWYQVDLRRNDRINVNIQADELAASGLDVQLQDEAGRLLASDPFLVSATAGGDGPHFIRIRTLDPQASYGMNVLVVKGAHCSDDTYEENDVVDAAKRLTLGETRNLQICPGDPDWFVVDVPTGRGLEAELRHDPLLGDLDLHLFDSDGQRLLVSATTTQSVERVSAASFSGGEAYLLVLPTDARPMNAYDLNLKLR